ncbi:MAG: hypothetical protein ACREBP_10955, partial [Sphingomicrobium sp.]
LLGAEMNAEIEHASPYGKDEGEKVPGEKRKIGPARMRAWVQKRLKRGGKPPSRDDVEAVMSGKAPMPEAAPQRKRIANWPPAAVVAMQSAADPSHQLPPARRFSDALIGVGVLVAQVYWIVRRTAQS